MISRAQRELHEERERVRAEAARVGRISARMERVADEVALSEAEPLPLDSDERDTALLAALAASTSPRKLVANDE